MNILHQPSQGMFSQAWFLDETKMKNEEPHSYQIRALSKISPESRKIYLEDLLWSGASDINLISLPVRKDNI